MVRSYFTVSAVHELLWQGLLRGKSCFKEYFLENQILLLRRILTTRREHKRLPSFSNLQFLHFLKSLTEVI